MGTEDSPTKAMAALETTTAAARARNTQVPNANMEKPLRMFKTHVVYWVEVTGRYSHEGQNR